METKKIIVNPEEYRPIAQKFVDFMREEMGDNPSKETCAIWFSALYVTYKMFENMLGRDAKVEVLNPEDQKQ